MEVKIMSSFVVGFLVGMIAGVIVLSILEDV